MQRCSEEATKFEEISRLMILIDVKTKSGLLKFLWPPQKIAAIFLYFLGSNFTTGLKQHLPLSPQASRQLMEPSF